MRSRMRFFHPSLLGSLAALSALFLLPLSFGASPRTIASVRELKKLSIDELLDIEVVSVSRKDERAEDVAAAVHVITEEDIRRSGARSIPEALRLAPNLQVAQSSSRNWAISARGFNASFSNKLLVLLDGRSVYTPLYSGVFWDAQDTLLEDLDRIEVISGPGATVWGANAVNGVINVISKNARDTQGLLLTAGGGTEERGFAGLRYGTRLAPDLHLRVYAKTFERDDAKTRTGADELDAWNHTQGGFRLDWESGSDHLLTLQGDLYDGRGEQGRRDDIEHSGGNFLARWTRHFTDDSELQVQTYYDRTQRLVPADFGDELDTFDFDAHYGRHLGEYHHLMIGAGYRFTHNRVQNLSAAAFLPPVLNRSLYSAFIQDEISFSDPRLTMALGLKLEHNDYTGVELQPGWRTSWSTENHTFWGAISRAVRTPSRFDRHLFSPPEPPFAIAGGPHSVSETMISYEFGWRTQVHEQLIFSASVFYNVYDDIRSISATPPFVIENNGEGEIYGVELSSTWQAADTWRISAGYTLLMEDLGVKPGRGSLANGQGEAFDPKHQFQIRSSLDLPRAIEFDVWLRYVDEVGNTSARGFGIMPDYVSLDLRVGWSPTDHLELAIVGQHLLDPQHPEFGNEEIERAVHAKLTWRY
jgi:Outer membrane receptor for ferrienterochelin and colicins